MPNQESRPIFIFEGNHRCPDFINTEIIDKGHPVDLLQDFSDLIEWFVQAQIIDEKGAKAALSKVKVSTDGKLILVQAKSFRAVLRDMVDRIVKGKPVPQSTIDEINKLLRRRVGCKQLSRTRQGFEERFHPETDEPVHLIVQIAEFASDLLCNADFSLIKKCENPACVLYFYDTSKNHARRWCSMSICGNRMKVAAHYKRHRRKKEI
jgi:predicted RNA-binding Zn ribbon-like protein